MVKQRDAIGNHSSKEREIDNETRARSGVAKLIVTWSIVTILIFGLIAIVVAVVRSPTTDSAPPTGVALEVFNSLLPVISAWVGAVLAYYFVNQATEDANRNTLAAIRRRSYSETVRSVPITSAMRTKAEIDDISLTLDAKTNRAKTPLQTVLDLFEHKRRTRAPLFVWDEINRAFVLRYVLHQSTAYEFLHRNRDKDLGTLSVQDLLDDPITQMRWDMTPAHLSQRATLADAKSIMETNPRVQDVVITNNGNPHSAFIGWLTNVDVLRHCVAGAMDLDDFD